jgi:hypothetical protein
VRYQIWSLGVVTWQLLTRESQPYRTVEDDMTCSQIVTRLDQAEYKKHLLCEYPIFRELSEACKDETTQKLLTLTRECLQYDAWRRPTARDLLNRFVELEEPAMPAPAIAHTTGMGEVMAPNQLRPLWLTSNSETHQHVIMISIMISNQTSTPRVIWISINYLEI